MDSLVLVENTSSDSYRLFCGVMKYVASETARNVSKMLSKSLKPIVSDTVEAIAEDEQPTLRSLLSTVDGIAFPPSNKASCAGFDKNPAVEGEASAEADYASDSPDEEPSFSPNARVTKKTNKTKKRMSMGMAFVQSQVESFQHQHSTEEDADSDDESFVSANEENTGEESVAQAQKQRGSTESHVGPSGRNSMTLDAAEIESALADL
jgi:hypothetical protein